jgi:hypothetical protein
MGSNHSRKHILFKKIVTGPRVIVSCQYKKDNCCLPARPDPTANKCDLGSLTIVANDTSPRVSVSWLTCVGNDYANKI